MDKNKQDSYNEWLVINSQLNDTWALNELLKNWQRRLFLYAVRKLGSDEAAQDVVQECLLSVARSIHGLKDPAAFPKWCFTLLDRRCADYLRKTVRMREQQEVMRSATALDLDLELVPDPSEDDQHGVHLALSQLDEKIVVLLQLYYQESFSVREIAEITGVAEGTVKSRLYYARKLLAAKLEDKI